ncbi:MAG TPA: hypothetical protein VL754_22735 [Verrucomicrobiae bacterium]|jgi:hypothetical protein|nr:hypothetical protein [Verrucomicrobiae bacterium]
MKRIFKSLLLLLVAAVLSSCWVGLGQLPVKTAVEQNVGPARFVFFVCTHKWLVAGGRAEWRTPVIRFEIWHAEDLLWEVAASDRHYGAEEIRYGVVPEGFEQRTPKHNQPPELKPDEAYRAVAVWNGYGITTFTYQLQSSDTPACE